MHKKYFRTPRYRLNRKILIFNWMAVKSYSRKRSIKGRMLCLYGMLQDKKEYLVKEMFINPTSYLLNFADLWINRDSYTEEELDQYLELASKRNYANYKYNKDPSLEKDLVSVDTSNNRLLTEINNKIRFKYEDTYVSY